VDSKLTLILGFVVIAGGFFFWNQIILTEINKMPQNYSIFLEQEGSDQILDPAEGKLSEPFLIHEENFHKVISVEGNVLAIESKIIGRDLSTGEVYFDSTDIYYVDRTTKQHMQNKEGYFDFTKDVKKQDYEFYHPIVLGQATFVFEKVEKKFDLEVYVFSCETKENDLTYAYTQFESAEIWFDGKCKAWVEPVSGKTIDFDLEWDIYFVEDGIRTGQVEKGSKSISDDVSFVLAQNAIDAKKLFFLDEIIVPIIIILIGIAVLTTILLFQKIITQNKLILQSRDDLVKKERLSSIGELSSRISHDLRNPLAIIKGDLEFIKIEDENPTRDKNEAYGRIERSINRIEHQMRAVLNFVKESPLDKKNQMLKSILNETLEQLVVPNNISINYPEEDAEIVCDSKKLSAVFTNIILNAIQAMKGKGEITIKTENLEKETAIYFIDTGPGIPSNSIDKVFELMYTTKQQGTGLGLVICKKIIDQHGGTISIQNNPTTFKILIPKA